ncbi:MAG: redoxin family protein [Phycisphaerae bacterium]|nr:redoxin family protein [Phycisphaerae bacterium]
MPIHLAGVAAAALAVAISLAPPTERDPNAAPPGPAPATAPPAKEEAKRDDGSESTKAPAVKTDAPAVPLGPMHATLFTDLDGKPANLADSAGKPMVIELWATWCGPCRKQRQTIHQIAKDFPDVVFVAASTDEKGPSVVKEFLAKSAQESDPDSPIRDLMSTPQFRAILRKFRTENTIPQTVYVTRGGEVADVAMGQQDPRFMRAVLKNLLKAQVPKGTETKPGATPQPKPKAPADGTTPDPNPAPNDSPTGPPTDRPATRP